MPVPVPDALSAPDPSARVAAVGALRFVHLKDPDTLGAVLDLCADDTPVHTVASDDPFAAFFEGDAAQVTRTVSDESIARLDRAGLPRDAWGILALALIRHVDHRALHEAAARWTAETRWEDPVAALRTLVPLLQAADVPLLAIVAGATTEAVDVLVEHALDPWHPRTVQELLNHAGSRGAMLKAIRTRIVDDGHRPDPEQTLLLVGLLAGWESEEAAALCVPLEDTYPWVVAYRALDDPAALPALRQWLAAPHDAPDSLGWRVVEVASQRARVEGWPLTDWVRRFSLPAQSFDAWGLDAEAVALLIERTSGWTQGEGARIEAWNAAGLLAAEGAHAPILPALTEAVARDLPWDADFVVRIASATPAIPGIAQALASGVRSHGDPKPALAVCDALPTDAIAPVLDALLDDAEQQPVRTAPAGPGLERVYRVDVDDGRLVALAERLGDPVLLDRTRAIAPLVRPRD